MTKTELKQSISDMEIAIENSNAEEKAMLETHLAKANKLLAEIEKDENQTQGEPKLKPTNEKKDVPKKDVPKKDVPKKDDKPNKKPTSAIKDANLTASDIATLKKFFGTLKEPMFQIFKEKTKTKKVKTVKPHSQSYKHAKRIAENVPKALRPALIEISKNDKVEKNKTLIPKVEKLSKVLTVLVNDLDLAILTESEERVDAYIDLFVNMIKKSHENNAEFKYESRGKIKEIAKQIPELRAIQFADGGKL